MKRAEELNFLGATTKGMFFFWNLPATNPPSLHLKIDGLEDDISFKGVLAYFQGQTVSFWEVILNTDWKTCSSYFFEEPKQTEEHEETTLRWCVSKSDQTCQSASSSI